MRSFTQLNAIAAALPLANVDTDKILAGQFLKTISREGLGEKLFWSLRRDAEFVLNRDPWRSAEILVALDNFGCGSSREHAPWALLDFGIRCVIAPSIADIFYNNCFKNGILPIVLPIQAIDRLLRLAFNPTTARMVVDLPSQTIETADGRVERFSIDTRRKEDLINGTDEIGRSLSLESSIVSFEDRYYLERGWIKDIELTGI